MSCLELIFSIGGNMKGQRNIIFFVMALNIFFCIGQAVDSKTNVQVQQEPVLSDEKMVSQLYRLMKDMQDQYCSFKSIEKDEATNLAVIFTNIYNHNLWNNKESVSGGGSSLKATVKIREQLPIIFKALHIKTVLDAPCGDFWWMRKVDFSCIDSYIGIDIVQDLIDKNNKLYAKPNIKFICKNLVTEQISKADLIICKDLFLHLSFADIKMILSNFKHSGSKYLLASTYVKATHNEDRQTINSGYRPVNLELPPFNFPKPLLLIEEQYKNKPVKYCGLWQLESLPIEL
jgi:hypothetical protein